MEPLHVAGSLSVQRSKVGATCTTPRRVQVPTAEPSTARNTAVPSAAALGLLAGHRVRRGPRRGAQRRVARKQQGSAMSLRMPLNPSQEEAVCAKSIRQQLIIAGAGSGKTTVLTERLAWHLKEGVDPREVLLLTFTTRAAEEMKNRAAKLVGAVAKDVLACTFHSFCARTLRKYSDAIGMPNDFVILGDSEALKLIRTARKNLGFDDKRSEMPNARALQKLFSHAASLCLTLQELLALHDRYAQYYCMGEAMEACLAEYMRLKQEKCELDFDDLQVFCNQLLEDPEICQKLADKYQYILVDEYQDTDKLQQSILLRLRNPNQKMQQGELTVVGDDAQGIYGFRGACIGNIQDFETTFSGASVFKLEENYRSQQPILDLANGIMELAAEGYRKTLRSQRPEGLRPKLSMFWNATEEAQWVLEQIQMLRSEGSAWRDIAVLFRRRQASKVLQVKLDDAEVPYNLVGEAKCTETAHMRDMLALLRCAFIPRHHAAWKRVLTMFKGIGEVYFNQIFEEAYTNSGRFDLDHWAQNMFHEDLVGLAKLIAQLQKLNEEPKRCVTLVKEFYMPYFVERYANYEEREPDFLILEDYVCKWDSMQEALSDMALEGEVSEPEQQDVLTLSTIHGAKGLEWNNVFIIDLQDKFSGTPNEEELRVLYVGITRARHRLFLSCPGARLTYWLQKTENLEQLVEKEDFSGNTAIRLGQNHV